MVACAGALARACARAPSFAPGRLAAVRHASSFLTDYNKHVAERGAMGIVPNPLDPARTSALVKLLEDPPADESAELVELLSHRVPPGVDESAYVKAGFLTAIAKGTATSPVVSPKHATELLGTMQGGYNIATLVDLLDVPELAETAGAGLKSTILMFDAFHDVEEKAKAGNKVAQSVMQSWADAEWFTSRPAVPEKYTATVFKVTGETNTDDLSPAPDAWSRPDIPLHGLAMLKNPREVRGGARSGSARLHAAPAAPHHRTRPPHRPPRRPPHRTAAPPAARAGLLWRARVCRARQRASAG